MFPELVVKISVFVLVAICFGGLAYVFLYPRLSGETRVVKQVERIAETRAARREGARAVETGDKRRKQIEDSLKEIEEREKRISKSPPISVRIQQAGLNWSKKNFYTVSVVSGVVATLVVLIVGGQLIVAAGIGFAAAFGFPRWFLEFAKKRRLAKFMNEFPNAVDVIVRGVKAGLPLADCIRICAQEAQEPVRTEFKHIVETQQLGISLADAVERLYERVPIPEANFFGIVVSVQQRSGGNLSEVLGNLSKVLRDRKKMKQKIVALSQEAKASAAIIASLPIIVLILVYMTSPEYISMLWTTSPGQLMMLGSVVWMTIGVLVMRKMINFDF